MIISLLQEQNIMIISLVQEQKHHDYIISSGAKAL